MNGLGTCPGKFSNWKEILGFHKFIESGRKTTRKPSPPFLFPISVLQEETEIEELKIIMS